MRTFSAPEACRRAGVKYRQLDYWVRVGAVRPRYGAQGSGSQRRFTREDLAVLRFQARVRSLGAPLLQDYEVRRLLDSGSPFVTITQDGPVARLALEGREAVLIVRCDDLLDRPLRLLAEA